MLLYETKMCHVHKMVVTKSTGVVDFQWLTPSNRWTNFKMRSRSDGLWSLTPVYDGQRL